jgi:hypothetical protein
MLNSSGILNGETYDSLICEQIVVDPAITGSPVNASYHTFHFFNKGTEQFKVPVGIVPNPLTGILSDGILGLTKLQPSPTVRNIILSEPLNLAYQPIGTYMGSVHAVGGSNAIFTIVDDTSGLFEIQDVNNIVNNGTVLEGNYDLLIRVDTDGNAPFVEQITLHVQTAANITNINLSNVTVEDGAPIGQSIGALTTTGGQPPVTFSIVGQKSGANAPFSDPDVDIFDIDIDGTTVITKNNPGTIGTQYTLYIKAEDPRTQLPQTLREKIEPFNITVVADTFINTNSYTFNGIDEYILINDHPSLSLGSEFTFSAWVKPNNIAATQYIAAQFREAGKRSWGVRINSTGAVAMVYSTTGTASDTTTSPTNITFGVWTHVAITFNGTTGKVRIYYNGILQIEDDTTLTSIYNNDVPVLIGALGNQTVVAQDFYSGNIDEVSLHNTEASSSQITEMYSLGSPTNLTTLSNGGDIISTWRMGDNLSNPTEPDEIQANDGTLVNMNTSNKSTDIPT